MRFLAGLIVGMMVLASVAGIVSGAEEEDTCAVLFDFGNGQVMWADVPVSEGMNAFNVTVEAANILGLDLKYSESSYGMMVGPIEGIDFDPVTWAFWGFSIWNSTTNVWESSWDGASSVPADGLDAIAWLYAPSGIPIATPDHRYPWTSVRHDSMNTGMQSLGSIKLSALNWSKNLGNGDITSSVVGVNGLIYVITGGISAWTGTAVSYETNSTLFCLNMVGEVMWSKEIANGIQLATPLLYEGMVIVPSADGYVYSFNAVNGTEKWIFDTESRSYNLNIGLTSSPAVYINSIIIAAGNGKLFSVNATNGEEMKNETVSTAIYSSSPAILDGVIYIGDDSGSVSAYAVDGLVKMWSTNVGAGEVRASPLIDATRGLVIVTSKGENGDMTALNMTSGEIVWQTDIGGSSASVAMASNGYVALTATTLVMVDFDGENLWDGPKGIGGGGPPTVIGDKIFAVTNEESSRLITVDLNGKLINETVLPSANYALCSPTFIDGLLFVTSNNGHIYAFSIVEDTGNSGNNNPWPLVGGIAGIVLIAAIGLIYWNGKRKGE